MQAPLNATPNSLAWEVLRICVVINQSLAFILHFVFVEALDILHAERIGHGYHVIQDAELYRRTVEERIHLEVRKRNCNEGFENVSIVLKTRIFFVDAL